MTFIPAPPIKVSDLALRLVKANRNAVFLDACSILDVIRGPIRDSGEQIIKAALDMAEKIKGNLLPYDLIIPSVFPTEWNDNATTVESELTRALKNHDRLAKTISGLRRRSGTSLPLLMTANLGIEVELNDVCHALLNSAHLIEKDDSIVSAAFGRVVNGIAPARKGKQEMKDCNVFEEVLALGNTLKDMGYTKSLIFVSSNTEEYSNHPDYSTIIVPNLDGAKVRYATTLNYAHHLASQ